MAKKKKKAPKKIAFELSNWFVFYTFKDQSYIRIKVYATEKQAKGFVKSEQNKLTWYVMFYDTIHNAVWHTDHYWNIGCGYLEPTWYQKAWRAISNECNARDAEKWKKQNKKLKVFND